MFCIMFLYQRYIKNDEKCISLIALAVIITALTLGIIGSQSFIQDSNKTTMIASDGLNSNLTPFKRIQRPRCYWKKYNHWNQF